MSSRVAPSPRPASTRARLRRASRACLVTALAGLSLFAASKAFATDAAPPVPPASRADAVMPTLTIDGVEAPGKHLAWFAHSAHSPTTAEPGRLLVALGEQVRPLAKPRGTATSP
ncbi:MAG TPA: hypothetical protein PK743_01265 [Luteimonas sp.]|nr:hypothetical protein [Luteimonas sp.]HRO26794.1 hypothetical protein [Luteimonas sp.]HRP71253.1 hypothetical protein [Luteimonas sp.]